MTEYPNVGDLVVLNSGGPPMSVIEIGYFSEFKGQGVKATWITERCETQTTSFPLACITPYVGRPARRLRRPIQSHWPDVGEA